MDIYHTRQHLHDLAARLADLEAGDIETLVAETTRLQPDHDTQRH